MSAFARLKLFRPILAGATLRDRLLAALGALAGIALTALISAFAARHTPELIWIVPPMGASAVLLFAVPASPMAQPWPVIGGNVVSALVGVALAHVMPLSAISAGLAVGGAIALMSILRCLHPPGGAAALVGLFAGASSGYFFPFVPVGLNAAILVASAYLYHRVSGHAFPHVAPAPVPAPLAPAPFAFSRADMDATLAEIGETYDISPGDLETVLRALERRALARAYHEITCRELMTEPVITVPVFASVEEARRLLVARDVRRLAVVDDEGRLAGAIGLPELVGAQGVVVTAASPAAAAAPDSPAMDLLRRFAQDRVHAVFVVDADRRPVGVITEADWLAVLARGLK